MKILITGGAGFIARHLYEQLSNAHTIVSLNSKELNLLNSEYVFDYIKNNQFDVIIHPATYDAAPKHSTKDPLKVLDNNLRMFFNILRCENYFDKMIYFGSGAEFGRGNWAPKMKEEYFDRYVPDDQYGFSKYIMAKYTQRNKKIYNLRLFAMYGEYDDWRTRFISNVCCRVVLNMPVKINQNKFYDFLYVDDLAKIVNWFIKNTPSYNTYNICSGRVYDFKTIAEKIIEISGRNLSLVIKTEGIGREYSGDNTLLLKELKSFKFTPIGEGLKRLYNWYNLNKNIINKDDL